MEHKSHLVFEIEAASTSQEENSQPIFSFDTEGNEHDEERVLKVRLDKWLWAARFYKTRPLARAAIEQGRIFYDGQKTIPSMEIEIGASIVINHGRNKKTIVIKGLSTRRRNMDEGQALYEEIESICTHNDYSDTFTPTAYLDSQERSQKPRKAVRYLRRTMNIGDPYSTLHGYEHKEQTK